MSIERYLWVILLFALISSCGPNSEVEKNYEQFSTVERDSLSKLYHEYSMMFYQPSEMHRRYKDTALMIKPDHVGYRQRLSYSYKKRGEHIKAMDILNEAVRIDISKNNTKALQYRAWSLLFYYRDYEGTIRDVDLINSMESGNDYTVCHGEPCGALKGQALYKLGRYQEAIEVFSEVLEAEQSKGWDPMDNLHVNFYQARCYFELGQFQQAQRIFESQLENNPQFTEAHFQLGKIFKSLGNNKLALEHFEKAKTLLAEGNKMGERYYEAFDEVFQYQIEEEIIQLEDHPKPDII